MSKSKNSNFFTTWAYQPAGKSILPLLVSEFFIAWTFFLLISAGRKGRDSAKKGIFISS